MARRYVPDNDEPDDGKHSWAGSTAYHPDDDLLRKHGFRIHARPRGRPAVWKSRSGELTEEDEAVRLAEILEEDELVRRRGS